jgi:hypothetical protein
VGARHRATLAAQALLDGEAEAITRAVVRAAKGGDLVAARLVLERILPPRRSLPASFVLPAVETPADLQRATAALVAAVASGELTPEEGERIARVLQVHRDAVATEQLQRELEELRERLEQSERDRKLEERLR